MVLVVNSGKAKLLLSKQVVKTIALKTQGGGD